MIIGLENELEEEIGLLQMLLSSAMQTFLQGTSCVKYVMLQNGDSVGSFRRVIMLKVKQLPTSEGFKKGNHINCWIFPENGSVVDKSF